MGCGRVGAQLALLLDQEGDQVTIMDVNAHSFSRLDASFRGNALLGDGTDEDSLRKAGVEEMDAFVFHRTGGDGFEAVFECAGVADNVQAAMNFCARGGVVCVVSVMMQSVSIAPVTLNFKEISLTASYSNTHQENRQCRNLPSV